MMADDKQKSALVRRHEQLKRWSESETNRAPDSVKDKDRKVMFQDGCVFLAACSAGDTSEVRALLEKGGNPNTTNVDGLTALHQACIDDNIEMVIFLLAHGANINAQDNEGWTPLHATASCGYQDVARYLIDNGADIARTNNDGDLPIDIAEGEDMEMLLAREMEKQNIDADAARNDEENRMLVDANNWLQNKCIQEVRHGRSGATALHVAAAKGYMKVMPILLQAGADLNARDVDGWTPLHAAAHWCQEDACKLLVDHMCDMDARTNADLTVFDVADEELRKLLEELKEKQQSIKNKEKKDGLDDGALNSTGKQHMPYRRRSSVNRINTEDKHNMVAHKAVEEGVILTTARDENHVGASNQDSEDDDELVEKKGLTDAGGLAGKSQESTGAKTNDKLEKTWTTRRDEPGRIVGNSMVAEESPTKFAPGTTTGRSTVQTDGSQQLETRSESARRNSASIQENLSAAVGGLSAGPAIAGVAGLPSAGTGSKATSRSIASDKVSDFVPPIDLSEAKEDEDQFQDDAFGSFNGVYSSGGGSSRHERLSRTGSLPSQLPERRGAISSAQSATRPLSSSSSAAAAAALGSAAAPSLQRIDSATAPDSWRAGLRKTGSSGAVSDGAYTPRSGGSTPAQAGSDATVGASDKLVQRSASSSVLLGGGSSSISTASEASVPPANPTGALTSQVTTRQQRPSSYLSTLNSSSSAAAAADAADRRHSAIDRLSSSATTTSPPSAYIPYYRRKQMERESKEREERERQGLPASESTSDGASAAATDSAGALPTLAEVSPSAQERRSSKFELPKRDEETETIRKMKAKQARATRRSTQGVTQEDVKAAEATLKSADKGGAAAAAAAAILASAETVDSRLGSATAAKDPLPSPTATTVPTGAVAASPPVIVLKDPAAEDDGRTEDSLRRHPWQRDDPGRSSFRKAREVISSSVSTPAPASAAAAAAPDVAKVTSVIISDDEKDKDDDDKSGNRRALRVRRNRRERRSTGPFGVGDEAQEKKPEEKEGTVENTDDYKASSSRYDSRRTPSTTDAPASATAASGTPANNTTSSLLQRGDRSSYRDRQYTRNATSVVDPAGSSGSSVIVEDFKKLYEEAKQENEKLKKDMQKLEQDVTEARSELEKSRSQRSDSRVIDSGLEKRERRALERRISELEEELKNVGILKLENDSLKQDNLRLKEENGALIRVISKLSK